MSAQFVRVLACAALTLQTPDVQTDTQTASSARNHADEARRAVIDAVHAIAAPCAYMLAYQVWELPRGDEAYARIMDAMTSLANDESTFAYVESVLAERAALTARSAHDARKDYVDPRTKARISPVQTFRIEAGPAVSLQVCLSEPTFPAILRGPDFQIAYLAGNGRLSVERPDSSTFRFVPSDILDPLPANDTKRSHFLAAEWTSAPLKDGGVSYRVVFPTNPARVAWMRSCPDDDRLPCAAGIGAKSGSAVDIAVFVEYAPVDGLLAPARVIRINGSPEMAQCSRFELSEYVRLATDDGIALPVGELRFIEDSTGPKANKYDRVGDLPELWRRRVETAR